MGFVELKFLFLLYSVHWQSTYSLEQPETILDSSPKFHNYRKQLTQVWIEYKINVVCLVTAEINDLLIIRGEPIYRLAYKTHWFKSCLFCVSMSTGEDSCTTCVVQCSPCSTFYPGSDGVGVRNLSCLFFGLRRVVPYFTMYFRQIIDTILPKRQLRKIKPSLKQTCPVTTTILHC